MTSKAEVRCKVTETTLFYLLLVTYYVFGHKMGQNPYRSIVSAKI